MESPFPSGGPPQDCTASIVPLGVLPPGGELLSAVGTRATWQVQDTRQLSDAQSSSTVEASPGLSSFELKGLLGRGGMGEVFAAEQKSLRRPVAVKRIRSDRLGGTEEELRLTREEFIREALITGLLQHPNIIPVHDLGIDEEGNPLLAMKRVVGSGWDTILKEDLRNMPVEDFLQKHLPILLDVAQGVAFAHTQGVVHRDLKPAQVMVGDFGEVLVVDWGLAISWKLPGADPSPERPWLEGLPTIETATNPSGTPALMAPEQTRRHALDIGPWTDIYLLGGTLYFLLTATYPHEAESGHQAMVRAADGIVELPSLRAPERVMPADLEALAMHCLRAEPTERLGSVEELITGIRDYLTGASKRRESIKLSEEVAGQLSTWRNPGYGQFSGALTALERAAIQWPGNEAVTPLRERILAQYAQQALAAEDLTLARVQAERLADEEQRGGLLASIERAALTLQRQRRQRRIAMGTTAVLLLVVFGGGAFFIRRLHEERRVALEQRGIAESRLSQTHGLVNFMLGDLAANLDLRNEHDRKISSAMTNKVLEFVDDLAEDTDRPETQLAHADFLDGLANNFRQLNRASDSLSLAAESATIRQNFAPDAVLPMTKTKHELAAAMSDMGQLKEALVKFEEIYREREEQLGPTHAQTVRAGYEVTVALQRVGDVERCTALYEKLLSLDIPQDDPEYFMVLAGLNNGYGGMLSNQGKPEEGLPKLEEALRWMSRMETPKEYFRNGILRNRVITMLRLKQYDAAAKAGKEYLEHTDRLHGPRSREALEARAVVMMMASQWSDQERALRHEELGSLIQELEPDNGFAAADEFSDAGIAYAQAGSLAQSLVCLRKALDIISTLEDSDGPGPGAVSVLGMSIAGNWCEVLLRAEGPEALSSQVDELVARKQGMGGRWAPWQLVLLDSRMEHTELFVGEREKYDELSTYVYDYLSLFVMMDSFRWFLALKWIPLMSEFRDVEEEYERLLPLLQELYDGTAEDELPLAQDMYLLAFRGFMYGTDDPEFHQRLLNDLHERFQNIRYTPLKTPANGLRGVEMFFLAAVQADDREALAVVLPALVQEGVLLPEVMTDWLEHGRGTINDYANPDYPDRFR